MMPGEDLSDDYLGQLFSPAVAVLTSEAADRLCQNSGLTFCELLKPFERVQEIVSYRDPSNQPVDVGNLRLDFRDLRRPAYFSSASLRAAFWNRMHCWKVPSEISSSTEPFAMPLEPSEWFLAYRRQIQQFLEPFNQEFLRSFLACIFVVTSSDQQPLDCLASLVQHQHTLQHQPGKSPDAEGAQLKWFSPNTLKFHVLLHDLNSDGPPERMVDVFQQMKIAYGAHACHFLVLGGQSSSSEPIQDYWSAIIATNAVTVSSDTYENVLNNDEEEEEGEANDTLRTSFALMASDTLGVGDEQSHTGEVIQHPLSTVDLRTIDASSPVLATTAEDDQLKVAYRRRGQHLIHEDVERLKEMVREFCKQALLPYVERQMKLFNEVTSSRKGIGKTLLNATKKWLSGSSAPNLSSVTAVNGGYDKANSDAPVVVVAPESWEMQAKRLADLAFLFKHYELAYQMYHMLRKEFSSQQSWFHYASSCEMTTICIFLLGNRAYPKHYMEAAVATYADLCKRPWLAFRAALIGSAMLSASSYWTDAAGHLVKVIDKDNLNGAVFLEEAARCFTAIGMRRKAAFHLVLAGNRYSKVALRQHAVLCYVRALRMYRRRHWNAAEAHINMALGQLYQLLNDMTASIGAFERLFLDDSSRNVACVQQQLIFTEYLNSLKQFSRTDGDRPNFILPRLHHDDTVVYCNVSADERHCYDAVEAENCWSRLERNCAMAAGCPWTAPLAYRMGYNSRQTPKMPINQPVTVVLRLSNPLCMPIGLTELRLNCTLKATANGQQAAAADNVTVSQLEQFILPAKADRLQLTLEAIPHVEGTLSILGISYGLCTVLLTSTNATDQNAYEMSKASMVYGGQALSINHKASTSGRKVESKLSMSIVGQVPSIGLDIAYVSGKYFNGQIVSVPVTIRNTGNIPVDQLCATAEPAASVLFMAVQSDSAANVAMPTDGQGDCIVYKLLPDGYSLPAGGQATTTLWIQTVGTCTYSDVPTVIRIVFYWTSMMTPNDIRQKSFRWQTAYTVAPSVSLDVQYKTLPQSYSTLSESGHRVLVVSKVQNDSYVCHMRLHRIAMHSATTDHYLESLLSERRDYDIEPSQWESICFVVSRRCRQLDEHRDSSHLSLTDTNDEGGGERSSRGIQFFAETWYPLTLVTSNQPLLIVFWSAVVQCSDGTMNTLYGQVSRHYLANNVRNEQIGPPTHNISYELIYNRSMNHDFSSSRLCCIPVKLKLYNESSEHAAVVRVRCVDRNNADKSATVGTKVHDILWTGLTCTMVTLQPRQSTTVNLTAVALNASVVDLKFGLSIEVEQAGQPYQLILQSHFITVHEQ